VATAFDLRHSYGCAALKTWGLPGFINFARGHTRDIYYNNGDNGGDENGDTGDGGGDDGRNRGNRKPDDDKQMRDHDAQGREARRQTTPQSQAPDFADMVLALWMHLNARESQRQAHAMKADGTRDKVQTWLDSAE